MLHRSPIAYLFPLMLVGLWGCGERRIEPEPAYFDEYTLNDVKYDSLLPHEKRLLDLMKTGELPGATASDFDAELQKADQIQEKDQSTIYIFELDSLKYAYETCADIRPFIVVQDKFGHVIRCGLIKLCL